MRVNFLNPGWVITPGEIRIQGLEGHDVDWLEEHGRHMPLGRMQLPEDAAWGAVYHTSNTRPAFAAIRAVETALPDFREPGSTDCKLHGALRNDLLNKFNGKRRELLNITKNYLVTQVFVREVVTHIQIAGTGVHNLPPGVEMPRK